MKITTAIIPVAGYGTRRLPITKAIEKCMLPIGNRPIIDYVVADCVAAGIRDIWFVVGEESRQIREYFGRNEKLEKYLQERGKLDELQAILPYGYRFDEKTREINRIDPRIKSGDDEWRGDVKFHYVDQLQNGKYGTTIPVAIALEKIGTAKPVLVVMGDDFFYHAPGDKMRQLHDLMEIANDGEAAILGFQVATREEASKYGVIKQDSRGSFMQIVENPAPADAPSLLINIAKYVFPPKLLELIKKHADSDLVAANGEYQILKPIDDFVAIGGTVKVLPVCGEYLDGGNLAGWLHANEVVGRDLLKVDC